jgi:porin
LATAIRILRIACRVFPILLTLDAANAAEDAAQTSNGNSGPFLDQIWSRDSLGGDWDGLRDRLANEGVILAADSIDEVLGNPAGGTRNKATYDGRLELVATVDLEKTLGWSGATFHTNAYWTHGSGLSHAALGGNLMTVSNIEATPSIRLFDLWVEQLLFGNKLSIRAGQIAADDEFAGSDTASNFDNSTFGWPTIWSNDLPSGGPIYDLATPGIRCKYVPADSYAFSLGVFNGDPAPAGAGDPQRRDPSGLAFRMNGGAFVISEAAYRSSFDFGGGDVPSTLKLGAWFHSGDFANERFDDLGQSLASPRSTGIPVTLQHDFGTYFIADQVLWHEPGTQDCGIAAFLRGAWAPPDRNLVSLYGDAGLAIKGLIGDRVNDVAGIAFAYARISADVRALDSDTRLFSGIAVPLRDYEATLEATYHLQLNAWWELAPDFQYVMHPGGNAALPNSTKPIPNAAVLALRSSIIF